MIEFLLNHKQRSLPCRSRRIETYRHRRELKAVEQSENLVVQSPGPKRT